ncbi:hypothetical protein B484DRAFT_448859 [Ochromonadaceae sp. CCMP2298]|nr:hypothetical protein B484DRAFT_448859 [Ochromonadaceae sp. CCMP2298]
MLVLGHCRIIAGGQLLEGKSLVLVDGKIHDIVESAHPLPAGAQLIDLQGCYVCAGLIDLQIYGSGVKNFGGKPEVVALEQMELDMLRQGVTGFLATIATNSPEVVEQGLKSAHTFRPACLGNFWGIHLEGPFLSPQRRGAHPLEMVRYATEVEVETVLVLGEGELRMMTVAPEVVAEELLVRLEQAGVLLSMGHSNASYQQGRRFLSGRRGAGAGVRAGRGAGAYARADSGAGTDIPGIGAQVSKGAGIGAGAGVGFGAEQLRAVTHLFNAMPPLHHRALGLIPAVFEARPYTSIVVDGVHVAYPMVRMAKRELEDRLFLITDAVTATNEGLYPHTLQRGAGAGAVERTSGPHSSSSSSSSSCDEELELDDSADRFVMPDGTLSGSALTMLLAVQNCVRYCGIPLPEAVKMASQYPAEVLGLRLKGRVEVGCDADLCVFDEDYCVRATFMAGQCVHSVL